MYAIRLTNWTTVSHTTFVSVHAFLVSPLYMQSVRHLFGWPVACQVLVCLLVRSDECELDKWRTTNERVCQRKATESSRRLCLVESVPSLVHAQTKPDWTGIAWQGALLPNEKRTRNKLIEILFSVERMLALSGRRDSSVWRYLNCLLLVLLQSKIIFFNIAQKSMKSRIKFCLVN